MTARSAQADAIEVTEAEEKPILALASPGPGDAALINAVNVVTTGISRYARKLPLSAGQNRCRLAWMTDLSVVRRGN